MKKVLFILFNLLTITVMAQTKGRFEVHDLGNCKLHVYYTNDAVEFKIAYPGLPEEAGLEDLGNALCK